MIRAGEKSKSFNKKKMAYKERLRAQQAQDQQSSSEESDDSVSPSSKPAKDYAMPARLNYAKPTPRKPADIVYDTELEMRAERCPREPHRAYAAFKIYLLLDPRERRLKTVALKFGVSHSLIKRWSSIWAWHDRTLHWDREEEKKRLLVRSEARFDEIVKEIEQSAIFLRLRAKVRRRPRKKAGVS
jgi:hypothetical protein